MVEEPNEASNVDTLPAALARHGVELSPKQIAKLDNYCRLLWDWNEKLNLTRHTTYEKFVARDLVDTLALSALLEPGERVLDVGTGGGVPGIPLAILRPDLKVSLCESVGKKARVVEQIEGELRLRLPVHGERAEAVLQRQKFDALLIRAVAPLAKLLRWFQPYWGKVGRILVIKGPAWIDERGEARHLGLLRNLEFRRLAAYPLPNADGESVVLGIWPRKAPRSNLSEP